VQPIDPAGLLGPAADEKACDDEADRTTDPFALIADWDSAAPDTGHGRVPEPTRSRPGLTATRWSGRHVAAHLYRDDPPA
jgi:hypothetical protein